MGVADGYGLGYPMSMLAEAMAKVKYKPPSITTRSDGAIDHPTSTARYIDPVHGARLLCLVRDSPLTVSGPCGPAC